MTRRQAKIILLATALLCAGTGPALAGAKWRIEGSDGSVLIGEIVSSGGGVYVIKTEFDTHRIPEPRIRSLTRIDDGKPGQTGQTPSIPSKAPLQPATVTEPPVTNSTMLRIHGSNTIGAMLAPALAEKMLTASGSPSVERILGSAEEAILKPTGGNSPLQEIEIKSHGSSTAFSSLKGGQADIGISSRPIEDKEVAALSSLGDMRSRAAEHVIALDGLSVIVHPSNPLGTLDKDTLNRIFSGAVLDWSELGGPAGTIKLYARDAKSGTFDSKWSKSPGRQGLTHLRLNLSRWYDSLRHEQIASRC